MSQRQMSVRIPEELHRRVKSRVALQDTTLTAVVQELLERWVEDADSRLEGDDPPMTEEGNQRS